MELSDYLKLVRRRWVSILLITIVCAALAVGYTLMQTKQYASSAKLFVSTTTADANDSSSINSGGQFSQARVQSYAGLVSSRELASTVIQKLHLNTTPDELSKDVSASVAVNTVNLTLTVTNPDAHQAQQIAQAYAEALTDLVRQLETPPGQTTAPIKATIVDNASYSADAVSPKPVRNVGLGVVLSLLLGFGIAVLRESLDTRVRSAEDVAELADKPLLGAIGFDTGAKERPLVSDIESHAPRAEAFRVLRTNLQFVDVDNHNKVFVFSSAVPGEGKTSTAVNLSISLAQAGMRTLLIEGDLRRPRAATALGLDGVVGLTNVLVGKVKLDDAMQKHEPSGLEFLASGPIPPNPAELLQSNAMKDSLAKLRSQYDVVIIDAPPLLPVTDAALLAREADGAILVVRHGRTTRDQVKGSIERLAQVDASLMGVVMNMTPAKGRGYGYGYGYGYAPDKTAEA